MSHCTTLNLNLPDEIAERIKNAVFWSKGWTLGAFVTAACNMALNEIEKDRGSPFPDREGHAMRKGPQTYVKRSRLGTLNNWVIEGPPVPSALEKRTAEARDKVLKQTELLGITLNEDQLRNAISKMLLLDNTNKHELKKSGETNKKENKPSLSS